MRYISTRGHAAPQTFCDILLGGLAPDGGLYLPESYPQISRSELDAWRKLSYADLAYEILSKFITDIPPADLKALVAKPTPPRFIATPAMGVMRLRSRR
jgi:threonine synthase